MWWYDDLYKEGAPPSQSFTRQSGLQMFPMEQMDHEHREDLIGRNEIFSKQNFNSTPTWYMYSYLISSFSQTHVIVTS